MAVKFSVVAFIAVVFCCITLSCSEVINISNGSELELFMCHTLSSDTTIRLYPGGHFVLQFNFCNVSDLHNITITGVEHVNITCNTSVRPNVGFGFISVTNLTIENITFINCGTEFYHHILSLPTSAPLYLSNTSAAVLLFMNCSDVVIDSVAITQYYGYAMVMLRVTGQFKLNNVHVSGSLENQIKNIGSGLLAYHYDVSNIHVPTADMHMNISHTHITKSIHYYNIKVCLADMYISNRSYHNELQPAGGLTLIYSQVHYNVTTNISHSSIEACGAVGIGAMLILHIDSAMYSTTIIEHCTMYNNHIYLLPALLHCEGAFIGIYYVTTGKVHYNTNIEPNSLLLTASQVQNHHTLFNSYVPSTIYIMSTYHQTIKCTFSNATFIDNKASKTGVCIYAMKVYKSSKGLHIKLHDIKASNNHQSGGQLTAGIFTFVAISKVTILGSYPGSSCFTNNFGSVISAYNSNIHLSGYLTFFNNTALKGAALKLQGYSKVFLMPGLKARFELNTAIDSGSVIWSDVEPVEDHICIFQIHNSPDDISMTFKSNKGKSIIHASPMYNCYMHHMDGEYNFSDIYHKTFNFTSNPSIYNHISSKPEHLYFCNKLNQVNLTCKHKQIQKKFYPGQTLSVFVAALDGANKSVGALVLGLNDEATHTTANTIELNESSTMCHKIIIEIVQTKERCTSNDTSLGYCIHKRLFSLTDSFDILELKFLVYPCPVGFMFDSNTGTCRCSSLLISQNKYIICNISDTSITIPPDSNLWIGPLTPQQNDTDRPPLAVIGICPFEFCKPYFKSWNVVTETRCQPSRTGLFCSQCADNKSVVFGSDTCYECSNYWLFTIIGYALTGILLIYILFKLQLTLTHGTINSLIFHAQVANAGLISTLYKEVYERHRAYFSEFNLIFLSTLNLNLGYRLCFYDGMTEMARSGLLFVFPFYLLGLLLIIKFISRRSSRVSDMISRNAIPVLATVIHLSFSRFLTNIIDIISPITIYVEGHPNTAAWYLDAIIQYTDTSHVVLLSLALLSICVIVVPYILLLLFPKLWLRFRTINKYCKPFVDAILAPYRDNQRHWFSLRLILQVQMYIVFACYRGFNYTFIATINGSTFIALNIIHCLCRPFKWNYLNILDTWFVMIASVIFTSYHFYINDSQKYAVFLNIMVLLVFLTFMGILLYHFLLVTGKVTAVLFIKRCMHQALTHYKKCVTSVTNSNNYDIREPLLEYSQSN